MNFGGVTRFTLVLAPRAALLMQANGREIEKTWILSYSDTAFIDTLKNALKRHPYYPLKIIVDTAQIDVRIDDLPPVSPWARRSIIERQRKHHFPKSVLECSTAFQDKALGKWFAHHVACSDEPWLQTIFDKLQDVMNVIEPLSFFPVEWASYAAQVSVLPQNGFMFVNVLGESFGLRQIILKDGKLVFTRSHTDCKPSLPKDELVKRLAEHMRSTLDYLPRLDAAIPLDIGVRLFVPDFLADVAKETELAVLNTQVVAITPPKGESVPQEWGADIAWLYAAARQKYTTMPIDPLWLRQIRDGSMKRNIALWVLVVFGSAGIYSGMSILTQVEHAPPSAPSLSLEPIKPVTVIEPPLVAPPELKLEAVLYNNADDWAVWINGEKHVPGEVKNHLTLMDVSPQNVTVQWRDGKAGKSYSLNLVREVLGNP